MFNPKFITSKNGVTLLVTNLIMIAALFYFWDSGVIGGRTGPDYSVDESPFGYYMFFIFYVAILFGGVGLYGYLAFNYKEQDDNHHNDDDDM